jgi:O-succinylbenzoate synthase
MSAMRIEHVELRWVEMPLRHTFQTSSSVRQSISHIVVRVVCDGVEGWGECTAPIDPFYCAETTGTCWHILTEYLVPAVLNKPFERLDAFLALYARVKGNNFAKAGLEMAVCVAVAQARGLSLAGLLGATRATIDSGVSLGIEADPARLLDRIAQHLEEGYKRIKLKIQPGYDVAIVQAVRARYPDLPLQVDANSAYRLQDLDTFLELDRYNLILIEQPLAHDDIVDHSALQCRLQTPICLDESLHHLDHLRHALDLQACRVVNIKVGRVGGLLAAVAMHDACRARGVPVWCGGMHESGIGRAVNVALAGLPGFSLPGDVSGSDKYYDDDLVDPPILAKRGSIAVSTATGLGYAVRGDRLERVTQRRWSSGTARAYPVK